ncbi:MAG: ankyrin repeat domain-containing protein, partial [Acetobacteraceae bacterium]
MNVNSAHRRRGSVLVIALSLFAGCILCPKPPAQYGPIDEYTLANDAAKVAADLRDHPADVGFRDQAGRTPLHLATERCRLAVIPVLLAHGADPNSLAQGGATPLHLAAQEGCQPAAELLLAAHADVNARDAAGRTPLGRALEWHQSNIVPF